MKKKYSIIIVIIILLIITFVFYNSEIMNMLSNTDVLKYKFEQHPILITLIIVISIVLQVFIAIIPAGPFQFLSGLIYGPIIGSIICIFSFLIGSIIVYLLTKKYGYKIIEYFIGFDKVNNLKFIIKSDKSKLLYFIVFIIPGSPKDILSYIAGLTNISFLEFILINIIGRIPSTILTTYSGDLYINNNLFKSISVIIVLLIISLIGYFIYNLYKINNNKK